MKPRFKVKPMKVLFMAAILFLAKEVKSQAKIDSIQNIRLDSATNPPPHVSSISESLPMPAGGYPAFYKFLSSSMKYPREARKSKVEGKVFVEFIVERDGTISPENVKVLRGVHESLDAEAVRVIKMSPKWVPGYQKGENIRTRMVVPLNCKL